MDREELIGILAGNPGKPGKKYPRGGFAPGAYLHMECKGCGQEFMGDKRAWECEDCGEISYKRGLQRGGINPVFSERLYNILQAVWDNRENLSYSTIEALEKIADKPFHTKGGKGLFLRIKD